MLPKYLWNVFGFSNLSRFEHEPWTKEYKERVKSHVDSYAWKCCSIGIEPELTVELTTKKEQTEATRFSLLELE